MRLRYEENGVMIEKRERRERKILEVRMGVKTGGRRKWDMTKKQTLKQT